MKAAAPIMGGISCPPVEEAASTAPANLVEYPTFFMSGIAKAPVVTVFAMELPLIEPEKPLLTMETFAGPPDGQPAKAMAISMKN
jgi:hypothetical protein